MEIKETLLGIVIAILLTMTVSYGINTFYEKPAYEDFCPRIYEKNNETSCENAGGIWINNTKNNSSGAPKRLNKCNLPEGCSEKYEKAREEYSRNVFLIALPLGIAIIILGAAVFGLEFIGAGLMGGGILTILYGITNYWRYSEDILKFVVSFTGLTIIILFSYWLAKRK